MANLPIAVAFLLMCLQEGCSDIRVDNFKMVMVEERADILWGVDNVSSKLKCLIRCLDESKCATFGFDEAKGSCQAFGPGVRSAMGKHGFAAYYSKRRSAVMHRTCENYKDCYGKGSLCFEGRCMCDREFTYITSKQACVKKFVGMHESCVDTDQCYINGSVCFKGKCMCTPGLSYHKAEEACVRKCSKYGETMSIYKGLTINDHNTEQENYYLTYFECIGRCTAFKDFLCLSLEIKPSDQYCMYSDYGYLDVKKSDRNTGEDAWLLATRDCAVD